MEKVQPKVWNERISNYPLKEEQLLFVSDIEHFSKKIRVHFQKVCKKQNTKAIFMLGDVISGLTAEEGQPTSLLNKNYILGRVIFPYVINEWEKVKEEDIYDVSLYYTKCFISDYLKDDKNMNESITEFVKFLDYCKKEKIIVYYYSGNHDDFLWATSVQHDLEGIETLKPLIKHPNIIFAESLKQYQVNEDLFILGLNIKPYQVQHYNLDEGYQYPFLSDYTKQINPIENVDKTIFVSHLPGKEKFSKLGSQDITNFKRRFKFKYHYHGHCRNYNGEYNEAGIPTLSVHFDSTILGDKKE